jgi:hypothetical protein
MRKLLFTLVILIVVAVGAGAAWIFKGREFSLYLDRHGPVEISSDPVTTVRYEGTGAGGILQVNSTGLSLNNAVPPLQAPSIGSTKDGKLGLASGGKVFPLGKLPAGNDDTLEALATAPEEGDQARLVMAHSRLSWPTPFSLNFMTGASPSWKRHSYQRLIWTKPNGSKLEMLWRYEQNFDQANGWTSPTMMHDGETGLIKIEITP